MQKLSLLADLVDIRQQIDIDQHQDRQQLKQRDRGIGLASKRNPRRRSTRASLAGLRYWIAAVRSQHGIKLNGSRVHRGMRLSVFISWLFGIGIGWLLARSVLYYDGTEPVNLLTAGLVLVGAQVVALFVLIVLSMLRLENLQQTLSVLNPAGWLVRLISRFQPGWRDTVVNLLDAAGHPASRQLGQKLLIYLAQHFTVALNLGMLAALLYLATISDLAFGWNTTLRVESASVARLFQALAVPWQALLPDVVPSDELVEASRFYRLHGQLRDTNWRPDQLGTWWIYLGMCIVIYGLLPRLIALVICGIRYDRSVSKAILGIPGGSQVLARMNAPLVNTESPQQAESSSHLVTRPGLPGRQSSRPLTCAVIKWSGSAPDEKQMLAAGLKSGQQFDAGGRHSPAEDREVARLAGRTEEEGIAIIAKSWEPPMLEFVDFIRLLRQHTAPARPLIVMLQPLDGERVSPEQLESWETTVATIADPWLYVEPLG